ncbi:YbhB/YbcL family Raf kinase inhibitor-like protein [Chelativorans alearense]|uniref:YbhB/YbcL family Raf kinase inhibitor-like protein n=1 Tax=Chelativorans alearense TaxID=2681495 RepID=UPI0013D46D7E|nr:YbhB/YbcL family Raf kinase inhibitor-like protein [Chelativorans alearense]
MAFAFSNLAFGNIERIPDKYVRDGKNVLPPPVWRDASPQTKNFMLVVEGPGAPMATFHYRSVYLPERTTAGAKTESLGHCVNDLGNPNHGGPQPPKGYGAHDYHFRLAALDVVTLHCDGKAKVGEMLEQAKPHIIAAAELGDTYESE